MAFQELNPIDISYKNKVFGNLVDPYEWNNNFITIENNVDSNVEKINTNFTTLNGEDGAKEIGMEDVLGGTEIPSNVYTQIMLLASRVVASYTKAEIDNILNTVAESTVANITLNEGTGQFTVTYADSTPEHPHTSVIDTDLEKVPASMALVESGNTIMLRITNLDGSYTEADVTRLIDVYTVADSDTIAMSISDRTITASIKNGSITSDKLALSVVTELQNYVTLAQTYATNAETSATASEASATDSANSAVESRSYAVGGTGTRQGEATDNAKYYSQQASSYADNANTYAGNSYASASQANAYANNASVFADTASNKAIEAANSATLAGTKVTDSNAKALIAEGWAKGTQNGEEVGSDSPYYHDNAKYWSEQAEEHISGQAKITATGLLKGMGNGVVASAVAGADYQPPLDFTSTPSADNRVVTEDDMSSDVEVIEVVDSPNDVRTDGRPLRCKNAEDVGKIFDFVFNEGTENKVVILKYKQQPYESEDVGYFIPASCYVGGSGDGTWYRINHMGGWERILFAGNYEECIFGYYEESRPTWAWSALTFGYPCAYADLPTSPDNGAERYSVKTVTDKKNTLYVCTYAGMDFSVFPSNPVGSKATNSRFNINKTNITLSEGTYELRIGTVDTTAHKCTVVLYKDDEVCTDPAITSPQSGNYQSDSQVFVNMGAEMSGFYVDVHREDGEDWESGDSLGYFSVVDAIPATWETLGITEADLPVNTPEIVTTNNTFAEVKALVEAGKNVIFYNPGSRLCFFIKSISKSDNNIISVVFNRIDVISETGGAQRITESRCTVNGTGWSPIEVLTYSCAAKDSPALTGTPTAPTAASGDDSTQIATTAFVQDAISGKQDTLAIPSEYGKILKSDGHGGVMSAYDGEDYISPYYVTHYPNRTNGRILTKLSRGYEVVKADARDTLNFTNLLPNTIIDIVPVTGVTNNISVQVPSGDENYASEIILFFLAGDVISMNITLDFDQNPIVIWQGGTPVFTTGKLYEVHLLYLPNKYVIASHTEYDMPSE